MPSLKWSDLKYALIEVGRAVATPRNQLRGGWPHKALHFCETEPKCCLVGGPLFGRRSLLADIAFKPPYPVVIIS